MVLWEKFTDSTAFFSEETNSYKTTGILARLKVSVKYVFCDVVNIICEHVNCLPFPPLTWADPEMHWGTSAWLPVPLMWLVHSKRTEFRYQEMKHWTSQIIYFLDSVSSLSRGLKTQLVFLCFTHYCTFMMHMAEDTPDVILELCSSYTSKHQQASFHQHL